MNCKLILYSVFSLNLLSCSLSQPKVGDAQLIQVGGEEQVVGDKNIDKDSLFCNQIINCILDESENWPVDFNVEQQYWQEEVEHNTDFDFGPNIKKEIHYKIEDKKDPHFRNVMVDYYVMDSEKGAKTLIKDYRYVCDNMNEYVRATLYNFEIVGEGEDAKIVWKDDATDYGRVVRGRNIKVPTFLYRQGVTIFHISTSNGVAHIVRKALGKFEKNVELDESQKAG